MDTNRIWNLTLTLPGEPERAMQLPQDEMMDVLRGVMRGETPAEAELNITPLAA
jgi:hypothetical protein